MSSDTDNRGYKKKKKLLKKEAFCLSQLCKVDSVQMFTIPATVFILIRYRGVLYLSIKKDLLVICTNFTLYFQSN